MRSYEMGNQQDWQALTRQTHSYANDTYLGRNLLSVVTGCSPCEVIADRSVWNCGPSKAPASRMPLSTVECSSHIVDVLHSYSLLLFTFSGHAVDGTGTLSSRGTGTHR